MVIQHIHNGEVYEIELPPGSRARHLELVRKSAVWVFDEECGERFLPDTPSCLVTAWAEEGKFGLKWLSDRKCRLPD